MRRNSPGHGRSAKVPPSLRIEMVCRQSHRQVALGTVSDACRLVGSGLKRDVSNEFRYKVISAVNEAFNNIVIHGYTGRPDGKIKMAIRTKPDEISVELRDWGRSFDPLTVPEPDLDSCPESGLGVFIMRSFTRVSYRAGRPNVLVLSRTVADSEEVI